MSKCFNEKTFCIGPYSEVRINPDGSLNFCHYADGTNIGADDNIKKITVDDYFQTSKTITNTRLTLEQGGSVSRCHKCYTEESRGLISFRHRRNIQAGIFPKEDFEQSYKESAFSQFNAGSSNPSPVIIANYLGWDGRWFLDFSTPIYRWIHQRLDLGWLI